VDLDFYYKLVKTFHIIFFTTWMAGIFYLPRIFVYHSECKKESKQDKIFQIMEKKLQLYIMNPSLVGTWLFGIILVSFLDEIEKWLLIKLFLVFGMTIFHFYCNNVRRNFQNGKNKNTHTFYRVINEIPTLLFILIIILVVFKPFV
jgi:protoporphyrinogen IX oxidase